jgi:hypothetical protein
LRFENRKRDVSRFGRQHGDTHRLGAQDCRIAHHCPKHWRGQRHHRDCAVKAPIVGMAATRDGGGIFTFGAPFLGSMGGQHLNARIVGTEARPPVELALV